MFSPALPIGGLPGWRLLQSTYASQREAFDASPQLKRDTDHFRKAIGSITSAADLVKDRRLLTVALGAFGLQDDINNKYFVQKMLDEGTTANDSLANRFADSRYKDFSKAFGLGPGELRRTGFSDFADKIIDKFLRSAFEVAAGESDETMRLALYLERTLPDISAEPGSQVQKWFTIMAQPPLRKAFEAVLGLPSSIGQIDIDQQIGVFKVRAQSVFGSSDPAQFSDPTKLDKLVTAFVARSQVNAGTAGFSSRAIALTLLGG